LISSKNEVGNGHWQARTIKGILTDRVYVGDMVQGKTRKINGKQIPVDENEWVCVPNTHEPIISRETFAQVQAILKEKNGQYEDARRKTLPYSLSVLKGKIYCATCGYAMHRSRNPWNGIYWFRCRSQEIKGKETCLPVTVREADVVSSLLTLLHKQSEAINGRYLSLCDAGNSQAIEKEQAELREINKNLEKNGRMQRSLYENMVGGIITADEYKWMKADYTDRIERLSALADNIRNARRVQESKVEAFSNMKEAVSALIENNELTAGIVDRLVQRICVHPDKSFQINLLYNDEFMEVLDNG
jgi:hypothetical protein